MEHDVQKLLTRLKQLEAENGHLKHLLDEAGISYSTPAQIPPTEITKQLARRFYSYFWGRTAPPGLPRQGRTPPGLAGISAHRRL